MHQHYYLGWRFAIKGQSIGGVIKELAPVSDKLVFDTDINFNHV